MKVITPQTQTRASSPAACFPVCACFLSACPPPPVIVGTAVVVDDVQTFTSYIYTCVPPIHVVCMMCTHMFVCMCNAHRKRSIHGRGRLLVTARFFFVLFCLFFALRFSREKKKSGQRWGVRSCMYTDCVVVPLLYRITVLHLFFACCVWVYHGRMAVFNVVEEGRGGEVGIGGGGAEGKERPGCFSFCFFYRLGFILHHVENDKTNNRANNAVLFIFCTCTWWLGVIFEERGGGGLDACALLCVGSVVPTITLAERVW